MKENNRLGMAGDAAKSGILKKGRLSLQNTFRAFRKRGFFILILFLIITLSLCGFHYIRNLHTASTILSLDYEEASKGLTPNGMRFNIFEIRSVEVMERLIRYAGLEGKITPDELSECISVKATHDKSVSGNVNYISTSFIVRLTNNIIDRIKAEDLLSLLCKAYREYFVDHYGFNHAILSFNIDDLKFKGADYTEHYRNKGIFNIAYNGKCCCYGFYKVRTHDLIPIESCLWHYRAHSNILLLLRPGFP